VAAAEVNLPAHNLCPLLILFSLVLIASNSFGHLLTKLKLKVMMVSQSVCLGVESSLELMNRYYFLSESCCRFSVGRPL
jgi:hypothetical protein